MGNKVKWIILGIFIVALVLFALNFNRIIPSKQSRADVDPRVYEYLNKTDNLRVIIRVKDPAKINQTATSLIKEGLQFIGMLYDNEFIARINTEMLTKLKDDKRIEFIYTDVGHYFPIS